SAEEVARGAPGTLSRARAPRARGSAFELDQAVLVAGAADVAQRVGLALADGGPLHRPGGRGDLAELAGVLARLHVGGLDRHHQVVELVGVHRQLLAGLEHDLPDADRVVLEDHPLRDRPDLLVAVPLLAPARHRVCHRSLPPRPCWTSRCWRRWWQAERAPRKPGGRLAAGGSRTVA